jgi:hypothetical protein
MTIEQIIEVPASHRLTLEIPQEVPVGRARVFIQFPSNEEAALPTEGDIPPEDRGQSRSEAFRNALRRAYGAWKDNPWASHLEDTNAMRDEWDHREPWNPDPAKRYGD